MRENWTVIEFDVRLRVMFEVSAAFSYHCKAFMKEKRPVGQQTFVAKLCVLKARFFRHTRMLFLTYRRLLEFHFRKSQIEVETRGIHCVNVAASKLSVSWGRHRNAKQENGGLRS